MNGASRRGQTLRGRGRSRLAALLTTAVAAGVAVVMPVSGSVSASTETARLPTDDPANFTPNVLDGQVDSIWQVGSRVIIGGNFSSIANATQNGGATFARQRVAAFNATSGLVDTGFAPAVNNDVRVVIPSNDPASVYIAGRFTSVNGVTRSRIARVNLSNGQLVTQFNAGGINAQIRDMRLVDGVLYIAGDFSSVGGVARSRLAALDPNTGAVLNRLNLPFAGTHNGGSTNIFKIEVTPAGDKMLAIGNFTSVAGQQRSQIAMIDLAANPAAVSTWDTTFYTSICASVFNTYMRDLDISADGRYAVISTTGAYRPPPSACDTISRFELDTTGPGQTPTWVSYTGGDTSYAVEIHDGVAYVGGHMRWINNPFGSDFAGPGAIPRDGVLALDVVNGLPFSWNPGRTRGVGVFDFHITEAGMWAGSDTLRWGGELRQRLAFFPWAGGKNVPVDIVGTVPNDVFTLGRTAGATDPSVLYRVNAGGGLLPSADDGPDWAADNGAFRNGGSNAASWSAVPTIDASVPNADDDRAPRALFDTERWDPAGGEEMAWSFPVPAGVPVQLRLYLANRCTCTQFPGQRIFDVDVEGVERISDIDLAVTPGHDIGTMRAFDLVSDGSIDVLFRHQVENPLINGIEIIRTDITPGPGDTSVDDVQRRFLGSNGEPGPTSVVPSSVAWGASRGAFMVGSTLYSAHADGTLRRRSFNGTAFGNDTSIELYANNVISDLPGMSGLAYDTVDARIYYTIAGQNALYWRPFTPESHSVGAQRFTAGGAVAALDPARVQGMFLSGNDLYFADSATGNLFRIGLTAGSVVGSPVLVDDTVDWRGRSLFLWNGEPAGGGVNQAPTAVIAVSCVGLTCTFDGSGSSDADGSVESYAWNFGDGGSSDAVSPSHVYASEGEYTVTLTVTDNVGATGTAQQTVTVAPVPNQAPTAVIAVSCVGLTCTFDGSGSSDADGSVESYAWNFGDGGSSDAVSPSHVYASEGEYTVTLTVTDNVGATGTAQQTVTVSEPPVGGVVTFRASASSNANTTNPNLTVPATVQPGDQLVLVITHNRQTAYTAPAGWTLLGQAADGSPDMFSFVYTTTAGPATAGSVVASPTALTTKTSMILFAYADAAPVTTVVSAVAGPTVASHATPSVPIGVGGSVVFNYWSDKTGGNAGWTVPPEVTLREQSLGSGGGQITAAAADSGPLAAGTWPGAVATSSTTSGKAIMWSIVVAPT
jgi:PKD repeat protein